MARLKATVDLLGKYGIYSLLDMHQDVYNEAFAGEGAPNWAVCTDGVSPQPVRNVQNWSVNYAGPGVSQAYGHLWTNNVVGNLQGALDTVWAKVAAQFRTSPWVVGYDPFNEPYGPGLGTKPDNPAFDAELECFYTGRAHPGLDQNGQPVSCPADDPEEGVIPRIEKADPNHLVAYEGNYSTDSGDPNHIGSMAFPRLVLNFHDYCFLHVPNGPEPPNFGSTCGPLEKYVFTQHEQERATDSSTEQPGGPGWLLTEFGATTDTADLTRITADANANLVGWIYWQWINYDDPTGSHSSALWPPRKDTAAQLHVLAETYASAVAGTPTSMTFDPTSGAFDLHYRSDPKITAPTVLAVPLSTHYPHGYCLKVTGAHEIVTTRCGAHRPAQRPEGDRRKCDPHRRRVRCTGRALLRHRVDVQIEAAASPAARDGDVEWRSITRVRFHRLLVGERGDRSRNGRKERKPGCVDLHLPPAHPICDELGNSLCRPPNESWGERAVLTLVGKAHGRGHPPGVEDVNVHASFGHFVGNGLAEGRDRRLGCGVGALTGLGRRAVSDEVFTMMPDPLSTISGSTSSVPATVEKKLTAKTSRTVDSSPPGTYSMRSTPALLTRMSIRPWRCRTWARAAR